MFWLFHFVFTCDRLKTDWFNAALHQNTLMVGFLVIDLTVCHFAFDRSASNLATSLRSWTDTSTFHTTSRIRPMHTTERESPRIIMSILGASGQPGKTVTIKDLYKNSIFPEFAVNAPYIWRLYAMVRVSLATTLKEIQHSFSVITVHCSEALLS